MIIKNPYDIETLPLFYSKGPSSPSFQKSTANVSNNNASSGSNSFVDSITSHISLPPYTPPDFNNGHSIKCDALGDNQNLLDSNSDSSSIIMVSSSSDQYSPSFSCTSSSDGDLEEEYFFFPRFGSDSEYSIVTTESESPIDSPVIEEEEEEGRGRGRGRGR